MSYPSDSASGPQRRASPDRIRRRLAPLLVAGALLDPVHTESPDLVDPIPPYGIDLAGHGHGASHHDETHEEGLIHGTMIGVLDRLYPDPRSAFALV